MGKWIWMHEKEGEFRENTRACFADSFVVENVEEEITLEICAVTKYMVYINGSYVGRINSRGKGSFTYDSYSILPLCRMGRKYHCGGCGIMADPLTRASAIPRVDFTATGRAYPCRVGRDHEMQGRSEAYAVCAETEM